MDEKLKKQLFNAPEENLREIAAQGHYLEQYKMYVESADKISERRERANSFFLTLNTGVFVLLGYLFSKEASAELKALFWYVPVGGAILSYFWYRLVTSYRDLNTAKFRVIHLIEEHLPLSPYRAEWKAVGEGKKADKYLPVSHVEVCIPLVIVCLHGVIFVYFIPWRQLTNGLTWLFN